MPAAAVYQYCRTQNVVVLLLPKASVHLLLLSVVLLDTSCRHTLLEIHAHMTMMHMRFIQSPVTI